FSLEDLAIDFIGRQYPEIPGFDRSPIELTELKYLSVSGGYEAAPVGCIYNWKTPKLQHLAVRSKGIIDYTFQPFLTTLSLSLTHLYLRGVFGPDALATIKTDVPLLTHLEFDWSDDFPVLGGHPRVCIIRIHARNPRHEAIRGFYRELHRIIESLEESWPELRTFQDGSVSGWCSASGLFDWWDDVLAERLTLKGVKVIDREGWSIIGFWDRIMMERNTAPEEADVSDSNSDHKDSDSDEPRTFLKYY
ncbi:hypothetical protein M422DRAFT_251072, partial [Sphaerobolus stellatus SS14]